jgi:hypothetical protein
MADIETGALTRLKSCNPPLDAIKMIEISQLLESAELYEKAVRGLVGKRSKIGYQDACKIGMAAFYDIYSLRLDGHFPRLGAPKDSKRAASSSSSDFDSESEMDSS